MTNEIASLRGRLSAAEKTLELIAIDIDCDLAIIRGSADPYEAKAELKTDRILAAAQRVHADVKRYRDLTATATRLKKDLGEE